MKPSIYKKLAETVPQRSEAKDGGGAVVTLSRDYGCPANVVAEALAARLGERTGDKWRWASKEIVDRAAEHFGIPADELEEMARREKGFVDDFLEVLSLNYRPTEQTVKDTLAGIVNGIAAQGNVIIVGRGSCAVLRGRPCTLHVRLQAPFDWRVQQVSQQRKLSKKETVAFLEDFDSRRDGLLDYFEKAKNVGKTAYDLTISSETFSLGQTVAVIEEALGIKGFI